ncbi:uncharacterized protein LOC141907475 isoform X2 [Tubulanus polymorphus]|uniref:uncharacterized protein LOC141907475 isoform X2 n=1 Tax=Tubulanus polymorphus TaxID=672921 RepID=UPI003DA45FF3
MSINKRKGMMIFSHIVYAWAVLLLVSYNTVAGQLNWTNFNSPPDGVVLDSVNVLPGTNILLAQEGKNVSITCRQGNIAATGVEFQLQVNSGAGGTWTPLPLTGVSTVWKIVPEVGKQYKCLAKNSEETKDSKIYQSDVISINILEDPCKLAQFQSLACTCKVVSKIGNVAMTVKWYTNGFDETNRNKFLLVKRPKQAHSAIVNNEVINTIEIEPLSMIYADAIQCRLVTYNNIELAHRIEHQNRMDVTYFPHVIQASGNFTEIRNEGEDVQYTCRTEGGRPDPTVIYQQKRRGSEQWGPIPDPQPQREPVEGGFNTTYQFEAYFNLHNGTSFRCAVKENLTYPKPRQFNPIIVHYFRPDFKRGSENETNAVYIVTVNSNPLTQQVTCDPPAVVQKLSNYQWSITIPIVDRTTTDYRGRCLADNKNESVIDVAGYHSNVPISPISTRTDETEEWTGGMVFGVVIGILILPILIVLFIMRRCRYLVPRKPNVKEPCRIGEFVCTKQAPSGDTQDELCHCICCALNRKPHYTMAQQ